LRRYEQDILYLSTRVAILLLLPPLISDLSVYQEYAHNLIPGGRLPYLRWDFEYPPLAYPLMLLPSLLQGLLGLRDTESYRIIFGLFLLPFDLLLYLRFRRHPPIPGAGFFYVLFSSFLALLLFDRFDLVVGFLLAWPFLAGPSDARLALSWGLGGALKLVPLSLAPLPAFCWARERAPGRWRRIALYSAAVGLPILLSCGAAALLSQGKISFLAFHSQRGVQIECLVASALLLAKSVFPVLPVTVGSSFGAQHLGAIPAVVGASRALFWGMLLFLYLDLWRKPRDLLAGSWLVILGFVTFGYVLSPQFLLWLIPIGICAAARVPEAKRSAWLWVFGLALGLTGAHFRYYWDYVNLNPVSTVVVFTRNLLLVLLWWLSWRWMRPPRRIGP
jgi:hypothetical protein